MKNYCEKRTIELADYIIKNNATIRQTANHFGISKSFVHKDIAAHLKALDEEKYYNVMQILDLKKQEITGYSPDKDLTASPPIIRKPIKKNS